MALGFGFNKAKVLASAERFVQQGKIQNAISEYEKIIKEDPKDLTVQNTVGDLYLRVGQNEHAAMYFKKVGDQYAHNGFTVKAIAVYKKLAKLVPNNAEYITKLAELYTQQGLFNDARAQYMQIADGLLRSGDNAQAARVFQRILELDPENAHMQAKLADLYMKIGKKDEARNIFFSAAESLYARGTYEAAAEALNKVISLDPQNANALLLRGMIAAGSEDYPSAITYLEQVPDLDSRPDGLRALLNARLQSNSDEGAESVATKLLNVHNDASGLKTLAEWYINNNHVSQALAIYQQHGAKLFSGGGGSAQDTLYPLINRVRDNPAALNMLMGLLGQSGDTGHTAEILELQAHASAQKGNYAEARDLYKKLAELEPENALHTQNYRQMLAKLGEDPATRILSPEEAAQALMVEELDEGAAVVHQKYDAPTETAIESALTDAELFVSYNVPSKAIPPLEAALPLAPHDVALNQRLATLYAKAERWADAAKVCQTLSEIYRELGHDKESARYLEASRKYALRAGPGAVAKVALPARPPQPPPAPVVPASVAPPSPQTFEVSHSAGEASVQEFSFDIPEHIVTEPEIAAPIETEIVHETAAHEIEFEPARPEPTPISPEVMPSPAAEEIDLSNEWENMLSVEGEESAPIAEPEQPPVTAHHEESATAAVVDEPQGGSSVCYLPDEKIDEVKFYISQQMWDAAKASLLELQEIAPDAPQITELMAAVAAGQRKPAEPRATEAFAASTLETPPLDYLPPPFAAPVPRVALENVAPEPVNLQEFSAPEPMASAAPQYAEPITRDPLLDLPVEEPPASEPFEVEQHLEPAAATKAAGSPITPEQPAAQSTEDILNDFVLDLESTELADFAPRPPQPEPAVAPKAAPIPVPQPAVAASVGSSIRNGHASAEMQAAETSATLSDILSDLQEETAEPSPAEEDPETHYNLGIAFKEMGLLDEAIGELQKVCRGIDQGKSFSQPIQAYTWLAQCLVDKGAPEAALRWYQKALQLPGLDDGSRNAIYYDLAAAYEASGDRKSALANFMEVYGSNIDFRDVASRIKSLKS